MKFDKQVLFLGATANSFSDGGAFYTVQMFDQSANGPVSVNIMQSSANQEMLDAILALKFGDPLIVTFILRPKDRLYKLGIDHVSF